jgi:hypothetical protein
LFPKLREEWGPLSVKQQHLIAVLGLIQLETILAPWSNGVGRPSMYRRAIARAFVTKAIFSLNSTRQLLDRRTADITLRRLCGWESAQEIPHESQFSRAFAEFSNSELPHRLHEALIRTTQQGRLIGCISRDSTAIEARENPVRTSVEAAPVKEIRKRGRPKKGDDPPPPEPAQLERQAGMTLKDMLDELPRDCNVGTKKNSKGCKESWIGCKLYIDAADGQIPISCILTSASLHDSQAAIPLALTTLQRVTNLYDLSGSAYDAPLIPESICGMGHIPIMDANPRRDAERKTELQAGEKRCKLLNFTYAEDVRYCECTTVERVNARLKEEFGGHSVRVRGHAKVVSGIPSDRSSSLGWCAI